MKRKIQHDLNTMKNKSNQLKDTRAKMNKNVDRIYSIL